MLGHYCFERVQGREVVERKMKNDSWALERGRSGEVRVVRN